MNISFSIFSLQKKSKLGPYSIKLKLNIILSILFPGPLASSPTKNYHFFLFSGKETIFTKISDSISVKLLKPFTQNLKLNQLQVSTAWFITIKFNVLSKRPVISQKTAKITNALE